MTARRSTPRPRLPLRWLWITAAAIFGVVTLVVIAGLPVYVFPPSGGRDHADVIYVIGPPTQDRIEMATRMRAEGDATRILISVPASGSLSARKLPICGEPEVTCETPSPFTTKGEADLLTAYAAAHAVRSTIVLTFTPHVTRTRFVFAKCSALDVTVDAVPVRLSPTDWVYQYAYQSAGFIKAAVQGCPGTGPESR